MNDSLSTRSEQPPKSLKKTPMTPFDEHEAPDGVKVPQHFKTRRYAPVDDDVVDEVDVRVPVERRAFETRSILFVSLSMRSTSLPPSLISARSALRFLEDAVELDEFDGLVSLEQRLRRPALHDLVRMI